MIRRVEHPHIPDGAASQQLKGELRKLVDQINFALSEIEHLIEMNQGGSTDGG